MPVSILSPRQQELCVVWLLADHVAWNGNSLRHICPQSVPSLKKNGPTLGFVTCFIQTIRTIPNVCPANICTLIHCGKKHLAFEEYLSKSISEDECLLYPTQAYTALDESDFLI